MIIRPTLHNEYPRKDGTCVIKLEIYINDKSRKYVSTKMYVRPEHFDKEKRVVKKARQNYEHLNAELKRMTLELEQKYLKGVKDINLLTSEKKVLNFHEFMDHYEKDLKAGKIQNPKGQPMADNTIRTFPIYLNYIRAYAKENGQLKYESINPEFYREFVNYLRFDYNEGVGLSENTIVKAVKTVKALMGKSSKYHDNREYKDFPANYIEVETIALTESEIEKIVHVDLTSLPHLERERDRFIIAYNFLLRFNDSLSIEKSDIETISGKKYLNFQTQKTRQKVFLPVFKTTIDTLEKYGYKLPNTSNQESNWKLKEIGKHAGLTNPISITTIKKGKFVKKTIPKYEMITTHTSRRSMATNLYLAGIDLKTIQLFGGWRSISMVERYLKIDKIQNAMKASEHDFFKNK